MKIRFYSVSGLLLTMAALFPAASLQSAQQIVTNWVVYNDHRPGPAPTPTTWGTAANVNSYDMRVGPGGNLVDYLTGQPLAATLTVTPNGAPDDFPTCVEPNINSPAGKIFFGVVDVANTSSTIGVRFSADTHVTLTFTGLDPAKHYVFRGTGVRGGSYPLRWTVATIFGTEGFIDAHSAGVYTSKDYPASMEPGQAAWNSGDNRAGALVGWDFITPAADGSFSIISSNYIGQIPGGTADSTIYGYALSAMLLAEVEATAPSIVTQPPPQTTVEQNRAFSLSVTAAGTPLFYQWYRDNTAVPGATLATYSVSQAAAGDQGNYRVVVFNPLGSVTSSVARVTVNTDSAAPVAATVFTYPHVDSVSHAATLDQLIIEYNEVVDPVSAVVPGNYQLSVGGSPSSVILTNERTVVLNLATPLAENTPYTVRVTGVRDLVGNAMTATSPGNPASFRSWASGPGNGLLLEAYNTGAGIEVLDLLNSPLFPNSPALRTNLYAFDTRIAFPDDTVEDYGARVSGVFIPPVSGNWVFHLRTFDRGELWLNPEGLDPAGKRLLVAETTGNNPRDWNKLLSDPVSLRAGQGYYIEGLMKAAVGVDVIKAAARLVGTPLPPLGIPDTVVDDSSISGAAIAWPLAPRDLGGTLSIAQDLADLTAEELHMATLSVQVNNPSKLPVFYQWFRDGLLVEGATGPSYSFQATLLDSGSTFSVQMSKIGSVTPIVSRTAKLTVVQDVTRPRVLKAVSSALDLSTVVVHFSEPMAVGTADDRLNYTVSGVGVTAAVIEPGGTNITLTVDPPLTLYSTYQLDVIASLDLAGLELDPTPTILSFVAGGAPPLSISRSGAQVTLSWPDTATGFRLQEAPVLATPPNNSAWTTVPTAPIVGNGQFSVNLVVGTGNKVYRLTR